MSLKFKWMFAVLSASLVLSACGADEASTPTTEENQSEVVQEETKTATESEKKEEAEEVDFKAAYKQAVDELAKAKDGGAVDFTLVNEIYTTQLQSLVQKRDEEFSDTNDQYITSALQAGADGSLDGYVVKQILDKLMQKVFYTTIKHEFSEIKESWGNLEEVQEEIEEAKDFYSVLQGTVEKRDAAYGSSMASVIEAGFATIEEAVQNDDQLQFDLGKQIVDKTLMKTFYYASGAVPNGYATKAADTAKENPAGAKVAQAEGWAFYQSIHKYIFKYSQPEGEYIQSQFDLQTDVTTLDPVAINKAFVRGLAKVALHEYEESEESWGENKSVITALEGALFIDMIALDIQPALGEEAFKTLEENAQKYLEASKTQDKEQGMKILEEIESELNNIVELFN